MPLTKAWRYLRLAVSQGYMERLCFTQTNRETSQKKRVYYDPKRETQRRMFHLFFQKTHKIELYFTLNKDFNIL